MELICVPGAGRRRAGRLSVIACCGALALLAPAVAGLAAEAAERIVSLAPHLTELAFTAGAGDRVVGAVEYSDYPEAARAVPRVGDAFRVDFERVLSLEPDVVLAWESGTPVRTVERLRALGVRVVSIETRTLADVAAAVRRIGEIAGVQRVAESVASRYEAQIASLRAAYRDRAPIRVFLQVNVEPLYTVNGRHIMSEALETCGGRNVFADLNELAPVVGIEAVIAANPEAILAADESDEDVQAYWGRWKHLEAVRAGNVFTISPDHSARATTRLVDGVREICHVLDTARARR